MSDQIEDDLPEEIEAPEPSAEPTPDQAEAESEARKYGWKPKDEYTLDPEKWVDAERFLQFPQTQTKILRDTKRELEKRLEESERARKTDFEQLRKTSQQAIEIARQQAEQRYRDELAAIQQAKRAAVQSQDVTKFEALERREQQVRDQQAVQPQAAPALDPAVAEYREKNEWARDPVMWTEMAQSVEIALRSGMSMSPADQLAYAEGVMRRKYPHMFQTQAPAPATQRVDSGGLGGGFRRGKSAADLPADVRAVAQDFVKEGVFKSMDEYAAAYFSEG